MSGGIPYCAQTLVEYERVERERDRDRVRERERAMEWSEQCESDKK